MSPLDGKHRWMFVVETATLLFGIFLKNSICECPGTNEMCRQTNVLFVSAKKPGEDFHFPSEVVYHEKHGIKLCFSVQENNTDCCNGEYFNCNFKIRGSENNYTLILNKETLSKQDVVLMAVPEDNFVCMPSLFYNKNSGFLLNIHNCLNMGNKNIRLSQNSLCGKSPTDAEEVCEDSAETDYKVTVFNKVSHCVSCKPSENEPTTKPPSENNQGTSASLEDIVDIMNNLSSYLEQLGNSSTGNIQIGNIEGVIIKLPTKNQTYINIGIATSGDITIIEDGADLVTGLSQLVQIPEEAIDMAVKRNGSFVGVVLFTEMHLGDPNRYFLNNEVLGIDMGAEISNLSHTVDIHFRNVDKNGSIASCRTWDGKGKESIWITDGCQTKEINDSITCHCSHLTFFAILMSPPPRNLSSSDFMSLNYITSIGCGLSMFFLTVAIFMHCLIRKRKANQATKILINLFVAMFTLNLSFLTNESIANLGNFYACVATAAVMHYTMLVTFTWFFIEALHLYANLWKLPPDTHYMLKIYITGWVLPAPVVIALLALGKYDYMVINIGDGNSEKMCWISDAVVHQGVNISYYAVVFIFTFCIFILTVRQIVFLKPAAGRAQDISSIKRNSFSVFSLLFLLGITWAFAFFSYGPLLIASYYIFTILNSFQGFFLFIYYYNSSKIVEEEKSSTVSSSSKATFDMAVTSPYQ